MLPGTFLYVYLGHVTGAAIAPDRARTPWEWTMLVMVGAATYVYFSADTIERRLEELTGLPSAKLGGAQ